MYILTYNCILWNIFLMLEKTIFLFQVPANLHFYRLESPLRGSCCSWRFGCTSNTGAEIRTRWKALRIWRIPICGNQRRRLWSLWVICKLFSKIICNCFQVLEEYVLIWPLYQVSFFTVNFFLHSNTLFHVIPIFMLVMYFVEVFLVYL